MSNFETSFKSFLSGVTAKYQSYMSEAFPKLAVETFGTTEGKKYIRVFRAYGETRSVTMFIDKTTGDVLKPGGWKAPVKGARGNIFNDDNGLNCVSETGSIRYLR